MGATKPVRRVRAEEVLRSVCGPYLSPHVRVMALDGKAMVVACAHPAIAHQLQLESVRILDAVNQELGQPRVSRLRFHCEVGAEVPRPRA